MTAPPLDPKAAAGPRSRWVSSRATSSARIGGVESWSRSATELRWMARGSIVTTVWSPASRSASGAKESASIGDPSSSTAGPVPRTS